MEEDALNKLRKEQKDHDYDDNVETRVVTGSINRYVRV